MKKFKIAESIKNNGSDILVGTGVVLFGTSLYLTGKAAVKANRIIEDAEFDRQSQAFEENMVIPDLTFKDKFKLTWKCYAIPTVTSLTAVGCFVGPYVLKSKKCAAFASVASLAEGALAEYRQAVIETIGEKKEQAIREKASLKKADTVAYRDKNVYITGNGNTLYMLDWTNDDFRSDANHLQVDDAINKLNSLLNAYDYASLNDFYELLGIERSRCGDEIGWNKNRDGLVYVSYDSSVRNNELCWVIRFNVDPRTNYKNGYIC